MILRLVVWKRWKRQRPRIKLTESCSTFPQIAGLLFGSLASQSEHLRKAVFHTIGKQRVCADIYIYIFKLIL